LDWELRTSMFQNLNTKRFMEFYCDSCVVCVNYNLLRFWKYNYMFWFFCVSSIYVHFCWFRKTQNFHSITMKFELLNRAVLFCHVGFCSAQFFPLELAAQPHQVCVDTCNSKSASEHEHQARQAPENEICAP
jgi:hypothetical protein